jgi:hypothetical protein
VPAEQPQISGFADGRGGGRFGDAIGWVIGPGLILDRRDLEIDLTHLESDDLDAKVEFGEREVLELLGEKPLVPLGVFGEPVIRNHQRSAFRLAQIIDRDRRDLGPAEFATSEDPTMPGNDVAVAIDQGRNSEAKGRDRAGKLLYLPPVVMAGIARIGL